MKTIFNELEQKVIKVFPDGETDQVEAVLYREVDSIGSTLGYMLQYVLTGEKISAARAEVLIDRFHHS